MIETLATVRSFVHSRRREGNWMKREGGGRNMAPRGKIPPHNESSDNKTLVEFSQGREGRETEGEFAKRHIWAG